MRRRRPTRRDLLLVVGELQDLVGRALAAFGNDRNMSRAETTTAPLEKAHGLCIDARQFDPPIEGGSRGGWPYPEEP